LDQLFTLRLVSQRVVHEHERGSDDLPRGWVALMKQAMRIIVPAYNTNRMAVEYMQRLYQPADQRYQALVGTQFERAKRLADWLTRVRQHWPEVQVVGVDTNGVDELVAGSMIDVRASVRLGQLSPDDVAVELYHGALDADQDIVDGQATALTYASVERDVYHFAGQVCCDSSGPRGYTLRVLPRNQDLSSPFVPGLIVWGS
jgi:starch phosphorylase